MAIPFSADNLDTIDAAYHPLYTQSGDGKFILTGVEGVKPQAEFDKVYGSLIKERNDHKSSKDKFAPLANFELADVLAKLDKYPELEQAAAGKLDDAAIQTIVEGRLNTTTAPLKRQLEQLSASLAEKDTLINAYAAKETTRTVHDAIRDAIGKSKGFQPSAAEDVLMLAERMFEVGEDGKVTVRDGVGATPGSDPTVWLVEMQTKRPHWWGASQGGGAAGGGSGVGGGTNPWSKATFNLTEQGRITVENPQRAQQLKNSAVL